MRTLDAERLPKGLSGLSVPFLVLCLHCFDCFSLQVFGITRLSRRPELAGIGFFGIGGALVATTATQAEVDFES